MCHLWIMSNSWSFLGRCLGKDGIASFNITLLKHNFKVENISESAIAAYINVLKTLMQNGLFFECTWVFFMTVFSAIDGHNSRRSVAPKHCMITDHRCFSDFALDKQKTVFCTQDVHHQGTRCLPSLCKGSALCRAAGSP